MGGPEKNATLWRPAPPARSIMGIVTQLTRWFLPPAALAALLAAPALLVHTGCEGTSSGVDNPGLAEMTVTFRSADGSAARVSGDLDVYGKDQNPAVFPEPLATVKVQGSAFTTLTGEDFDRIYTAGKIAAATKRAAGPAAAEAPTAPAVDSPVAFNVVFRSDAKTGTLSFGLVYDPKRKAFLRGGQALSRLDLSPKALQRYRARLAREDVHGELGRVYIPGTPFQATLDDTGFVFEDLPEGVFPMRLLNAEGRIFPVRESLDTRQSRTFTASLVPVGTLDTVDTLKPPARFEVFAGGIREAAVGILTVLEAKILGLDSTDRRISVLWRPIKPNPADTAVRIANPTNLLTQVKFSAPGAYAIELVVTVGTVTMKDTAQFRVREAPLPTKPRVLQPRVKDSLLLGAPTQISWEMPVAGFATVELSLKGGVDWQIVAKEVVSNQGITAHRWTPDPALPTSASCLIRVRLQPRDTSLARDSLVATMEGPFLLAPAAKIEKPQ